MSDLASQRPTPASMPAPPESGLVRVAAWSSLPWLRAAFSTRVPGLSQCYGAAEQNLGWTAEDEAARVAANRQQFYANALGGAAAHPITVSQVHGSTVHEVADSSSMGADGRGRLEGDGLLTATPGLTLAILTADCVPVLLADTRTRIVAAVHAGWRGTLAGIVGEVVQRMAARGARPQDLVAAIGPAIRPCCFEVGGEVRSAFLQTPLQAEDLFTPSGSSAPGKFLMDLQEANRRQLLAGGLAPEQIQTVAECTACCRRADGGRKYFSYRAEGGRTGRMLSLIATVPA